MRSTSRSWPTMTRLISNSTRSSRAASTDGGTGAPRLRALDRGAGSAGHGAPWSCRSRPPGGRPSTGRHSRPGASVLHVAGRHSHAGTLLRPARGRRARAVPHPCPRGCRLLASIPRRAAPPVAARRLSSPGVTARGPRRVSALGAYRADVAAATTWRHLDDVAALAAPAIDPAVAEVDAPRGGSSGSPGRCPRTPGRRPAGRRWRPSAARVLGAAVARDRMPACA